MSVWLDRSYSFRHLYMKIMDPLYQKLNKLGPGILTARTIRAATTDILLLGTCWPIPHKADEHTQSLIPHLQQYIKKGEEPQRQPIRLDQRHH